MAVTMDLLKIEDIRALPITSKLLMAEVLDRRFLAARSCKLVIALTPL